MADYQSLFADKIPALPLSRQIAYHSLYRLMFDLENLMFASWFHLPSNWSLCFQDAQGENLEYTVE